MKTRYILFFFLVIACGKKNDGNNAIPNLNFDDVSVMEGTGGINGVQVKLTLSQPTSKQVSVTFSTIDGTATAANDFTAISSQAVTFQPNETEKTVTVNVVADDIKENDEIFQVRVQNPSNVNLLKSTGTVTLKNDDTKIPFNNTGYDAAGSYSGYTLAWSDEFNGTALASDAWTAETGDGCPSLCGWGNNELQYYSGASSNVFFQEGKMIIEARQESVGNKNYTSARIKTQGKKSFRFGRIDIRAILPRGKGIWPAFWLLPQDNVYGGWPKSGEIDLMELVGQEPSKVSGTLHFGPGPNSIWISRSTTLPSGTFNDQFHLFSLEWKQDEIRWLVDDIPYATLTKADIGNNIYPFNEKFYFIINLAVGGNLPGSPDAGTLFPQWLVVDYIRMYQN